MDKRGKVKKSLVREFSAGGAVFRKKVAKVGKVPPRKAQAQRGKQVSKVEWLIIKPAGTERWQLPKGNIDQGESAKEAGVREVFEETGVRARLLNEIGSSQYFYALSEQRIFKTVKYFLMEARGGKTRTPAAWAHEIDKVLWLGTQAALKKLTHKDERVILEKAEKVLGQGVQERIL